MTATLDHILNATTAKPTGLDRWIGHCPSHQSKKHRDLSIRLTEKTILVHCFAGCEVSAICQALNICIRDLFTNRCVNPEARRRRDAERRARERQRERDGLRLDAFREAESTIAAARGLDISGWSHEQLNTALQQLADAYALLESETP